MGPTIWIVSAVILGLLFASAFFAASETAITAASRPRMFALARKGNARARLVARLRDQRNRFISTIMIGNNVVNILASALATGLLIDLFGERGVFYATAVMTVLVVVFGEVLPKTFALTHADRLALALAPAVKVVMAVLAPLASAVSWLVAHVLTLFRVDRPPRSSDHAADELRGAIELHGARGPGVGEHAMLSSILDLASVTVGEIMVHRNQVFAIDVGQPRAAVLEQALASPHTRVPLYRGSRENIVGVLHAKALLQALRAAGGRAEAIDVQQVAARPWFIPESTSLVDQLQAFRRRREHFALVVDEYGALQGIVTLEDILEEIVGEIEDEHDVKMPHGRVPRQGGPRP